MIARNARIAAIRKSFNQADLSRQLPVPNDETRSCVAMDANRNILDTRKKYLDLLIGLAVNYKS